jgi:hypothetical protein
MQKLKKNTRYYLDTTKEISGIYVPTDGDNLLFTSVEGVGYHRDPNGDVGFLKSSSYVYLEFPLKAKNIC